MVLIGLSIVMIFNWFKDDVSWLFKLFGCFGRVR